MHRIEKLRTLKTCFAAAAKRKLALLTMLFTVLGGGAAVAIPEIAVEVGGTPISDGGSINFGLVVVNEDATRTVTVRNTGADPLLGLGLSKAGANSGDFNYTNLGAAFLGPGGSTTFSITFTPSQSGGRTAIVRISSNDINENPYDLNLTGTGTAPEIAVVQGSSTVLDGGSINFSYVRVGIRATRTITIRNTGNGTLSGLSASLSGGSAFEAEAVPVSSLGSGGSTSFEISYSPTAEVESTATLQIFSNDTNENPYDISLRGTGAIPYMEVEQPAGTPLNDESSLIDFGTTDPGVPVPLTFTLRNSSTGALTGLAITKDGTDPLDFSISGLPPTLAMGATTTFTVSFNPGAPGERTAAIHIASNESGAQTFDIDVKGVGTALSDFGDADGDGTVNLLEEATGNDPFTAGPPPGTVAMSGNNLEFTFTKSVAYLFQVYYIVEWSDDLATWNGTPDENSTIVSDDGVVQVVKYTMPAGPNGERFMRLRVMRV